MKKLANLKGAKALNKQEQQSINGGGIEGGCDNQPNGTYCAGGHWCCNGVCTQYENYGDYIHNCLLADIHPGHGD